MKPLSEITEIPNLLISATGIDGGCGHLYLNSVNAEPMAIVWSNGGGWEHVSVSYRRKTPTWDEMCRVKELFFNDDETVVQYHPCKSEYVNIHQHCLHLWRKCGENAELPPKIFV